MPLENVISPLRAPFLQMLVLLLSFSRVGFVSKNARNAHERDHRRPWKCPFTTCEFSIIGFGSLDRKDARLKRFHEDETELTMAFDTDKINSSDFGNLDENEVQPLLFILVRAGNVEAIERLLSSPSGSKIKLNVRAGARNPAARKGLLNIAQLLTPEDEHHLPTNIIIHYAVESADPEIFRWALDRVNSDDIDAGKLNKIMLSTPSDGIYSIWETILPFFSPVIKTLFTVSTFRVVKNNALREERLAHIWNILFEKCESYDWEETLEQALYSLAKSAMSIRLGRALLELGARKE
ncbi:hypothetical protein F5Y03DRAFT_403320 [Xylaria venustula]|nr:hypothetical protein F5Y03DRAFT_403320 [Xylaria venustula]